MRQHLRYSVNVCTQRDLDDRVAVPEAVLGDSFLDAQCGGDFFEVEIVFGIAQHGQ